MPENPSTPNLQHIRLPLIAPEDRSHGFRMVTGPRGDSKWPTRPDKKSHGEGLKQQVESIRNEFEETTPDLETWKESLSAFGLILEVSGAAGCALATGALDDRIIGIKLLQEKQVLGDDDKFVTVAVIFVPYGGLEAFLEKFDAYIAEPEEGKSRKRDELITGIETIQRASIKALWNDPVELLPAPGRVAWWEAWVRRDGSAAGYPEDELFQQFIKACDIFEIARGNEVLVLPEQFVLLIKGSMEQIGSAIPALNALQELRRPKVHAGFFMNESPVDQRKWSDSLLDRVTWPDATSVAVTLLDTGVNRAHPLIEQALDTQDCDAYEKSHHGVDDRDGHGTQMAGLALFGDLTPILDGHGPIHLKHRLESVKMIPRSGTVHDPILYARVTEECMDRPETWLESTPRKRAYCLTICSEDHLDRGRPSAWSAALDTAILNRAQTEADQPRIVCVSAGNLSRTHIVDYPKSNQEHSIHDPAQSWNAITVGAYTEKDLLFDKKFLGWETVAPPGGLCPSSTTGINWNKNWPIKPDIVMEGGNYAQREGSGDLPDTPDDLQLLTTHHQLFERMYATAGDTSAAAAQAARYCAIIQGENSDRWPETIRALLIHSAKWTAQMTGWQPKHEWKPPSKLTKGRALELIQQYGFGVPDLSRALKSAQSSVTMIAEEVIQPFSKERNEEGTLVEKVKGYNRHYIPIPQEVLNANFDKRVRMRVTLSYYVDPNPTNPLVASKYSYQGAGLRFEVKSKSDTDEQFFARINQLESIGEDKKGDSDSAQWLLGYKNRSRGSLHNDTWYGNAAELVSKDCIAIFPVGGWWKYRPFLGKLESSLRYSLLVSVEIEDPTVDLYTPIATRIEGVIKV
jgi:hypothetical protein